MFLCHEKCERETAPRGWRRKDRKRTTGIFGTKHKRRKLEGEKTAMEKTVDAERGIRSRERCIDNKG